MATTKEETKEAGATEDDSPNINGDTEGRTTQSKKTENDDNGPEGDITKDDTKNNAGHEPTDTDKEKKDEGSPPVNAPGKSEKTSPTAGTSHAAAAGEPKVIKKGDQVITSYVDEKTGKIAAYEIGIKLEVSDFSQPPKWFPARVVELDAGEQEIRVHFDNWSTRFDEWIKMDSNRLRPAPNTNIVKTTFKVGEKVEAIWGMDGQRYPGEILSVLPNDYYQVLFDDGIRYKKKYNQIFKLKMTTRGSTGRLSGDGAPTMPPTAHPKLAKPLPKLTPAPFLLGNADGHKFNQQPVSSLPPNVPLLANAAPPKGKRVERQPSMNRPLAVQMQEETHQGISQFPAAQASVTPKSSLCAPTELGKRRRTVQNYSQLLNPNLRLSPPPNSPNTSGATRRRTSSKIVDEQDVTEAYGHGVEKPLKSGKTTQVHPGRKTIGGSEEIISAKKSHVKGGGVRKSLPATPREGSSELHTESGQENLPSIQSSTDVTPASSGTTPDTLLTHSKRKRTIHDYSMLVKSRIPKSFVVESDSPPKQTRRRRRNLTPNEQEQSAESPTPSIYKAQDDTSSQNAGAQEHQPEAPSVDSHSAKVRAKAKSEEQKTDQISTDLLFQGTSPKRSLVKQAAVLTEFDMFAPKKKSVVSYRNVPKSPGKISRENSGPGSYDSEQGRIHVGQNIAAGKRNAREIDDEELMDISGYERRENSAEEMDLESEPIVQPPPVVIRRPGRPFKKNKPPPGHWSYGIPVSVATTSNSAPVTSSADHQFRPSPGPKTSPPVAHHPASRVVKNLKTPILPLSTGQESNELLSGLSSAKIEKLQRKLLENEIGFCPEFEPLLKDASVDVINCACGSKDEHGFMIQCEFCHCWQHGSCHGFTEDSEMPTFYVCETCQYPFHTRESLKYEWNQEFKRKGRLPRLTLGMERDHELEQMILESSELQDRLYQILDIIYSNRVKLHIANKMPEHPKIYQWDKPSLPASDDLKMRLYKKVYKPVLRRLLYYHANDEGYKEKLIQQVERRFNPDAAPPASESLLPVDDDTQQSKEGTMDIAKNEVTTATANCEVSDNPDTAIATPNFVKQEEVTVTGEANANTSSSSSSESVEAEVKQVLDDIITKIEIENTTLVKQELELEPPTQTQTDTETAARPTELNILGESAGTSDKGAGVESEKKGQTPLADDLSMLGNIGELTSKCDPTIDALLMSIFNDPDFEKSFDAPMVAGADVADAFAMKELMPAPPVVTTPAIVPTLERITPDMCRANLLNHIDDQQNLVDQCLELVENKIKSMEEARSQGIQPSQWDNQQLMLMQSNVRNLLSAFELLKGMPVPVTSNSQSLSNGQSPGNENDPNVIPMSLRAISM